MELEFFASCLGGLEQVLADELRSFGAQRVRPLGGGVAFFCEPAVAYRACLWSRLASRVMLVLKRVNAGDAALLYAGAYDIAWEEVLAADATFSVRAHGTNESLRNTRFTALKVKDAIADRLRSRRGERADAAGNAGEGPRVAIDVRVHDRRATVSLDFSGEALNHRDYFVADTRDDAALACSLAAGALALAGWSERAAAGAALVDPVCNDGIVLVEAALVACDRAPALQRRKWGFSGWAQHDPQLWSELLAEANERFAAGLARIGGERATELSPDERPDSASVRFLGLSTSSPSIRSARNHLRRAGVRPVVSVELGDASNAAEAVARAFGNAGDAQAGMFVASAIDAASRSDAPARVRADEAAFVAACEAAPEGSGFVAVGAQDACSRFSEEATERHVLGAGRVETAVDVFSAPPVRATRIQVADMFGGAPHEVQVLEPASDQFAARLRKVFKERRKWAAREGVTCYRLYDSDLPDYAVAIDWYTGAGDARGNDYLHIAEYAPPSSVDAGKAARRFGDVLAIAPIVCGVRPDHVFAKRRVREKGGGQYRNAGTRPYPTTIEEGGYSFEVDLAGRLDTGLFLDHRLTRELVRECAKGTRFLNLFAYTGTASVYAAGGGAASTTTVDLSATYLDWARRNMAANGFTGKAHEFVKADVLKWITQTRRTKQRFDLVFVDPPTFSNSKAMGRKTWDVQRDHVELLIGVVHLLAEGGQAIFSCNLRTFKPDVEKLERYGVAIEDVSASTIPPDFARTPKIHKCYRVHRA